jgi:hypothetical protein
MSETITIRIPKDLAKRMDDVRHASESREAYARRLLDKAVAAEERKAAKR